MDKKKCSRCQEVRPVSAYYKSKNAMKSECKKCSKKDYAAYQKFSKETNGDHVRLLGAARSRAYRMRRRLEREKKESPSVKGQAVTGIIQD